MDISGNPIVVGTCSKANGVGRAYVFTKTGNGWRQSDERLGTAKEYFGESVAISGNRFLVGVAGPAHVFRG